MKNDKKTFNSTNDELLQKIESLDKKLEELNYKLKYILVCMKYWIR